MNRRIVWTVGMLLAALSSLAGSAQAGPVTLVDTYYVAGPNGLIGSPPVPQFTLAQGGTLTVTLEPIKFGAPLSTLQFELSNATGTVIDAFSGTNGQSMSFAVQAGTFFALSFGSTAAGTGTDVGFYSLDVDYVPASPPAPVPVPRSGALLTAGLAALALVGRRRRASGWLAADGWSAGVRGRLVPGRLQ